MELSTLFTPSSFKNFWPIKSQSRIEQLKSVARFIVYGTLITFLIKRNVRILVIGAILFAAVYYYTNSLSKTPDVPDLPCSAFNPDDPLGNFGYNKCYKPKDVQWWSNMAFTSDRRNAERNWYTVPTNDLDSHIDFVYGGRKAPFCRQDQSACIADANPRFMDQPQRYAMRAGPSF